MHGAAVSKESFEALQDEVERLEQKMADDRKFVLKSLEELLQMIVALNNRLSTLEKLRLIEEELKR